MYPERSLVLQFVGFDEPPSTVTLSGAALPKVVALESGAKGWTYDAASKCVWVRMSDARTEMIVTIR